MWERLQVCLMLSQKISAKLCTSAAGMLKVAWDKRTCLQAHSHVYWQGNVVLCGYLPGEGTGIPLQYSSSCQALYKVSENMAVCFLQRKGKGKRDPKMETIVFFNLSS